MKIINGGIWKAYIFFLQVRVFSTLEIVIWNGKLHSFFFPPLNPYRSVDSQWCPMEGTPCGGVGPHDNEGAAGQDLLDRVSLTIRPRHLLWPSHCVCTGLFSNAIHCFVSKPHHLARWNAKKYWNRILSRGCLYIFGIAMHPKGGVTPSSPQNRPERVTILCRTPAWRPHLASRYGALVYAFETHYGMGCNSPRVWRGTSRKVLWIVHSCRGNTHGWTNCSPLWKTV